MLGKINRMLVQISNGMKNENHGSLSRRDVALLNSTMGACDRTMSHISTYGSQVIYLT